MTSILIIAMRFAIIIIIIVMSIVINIPLSRQSLT